MRVNEVGETHYDRLGVSVFADDSEIRAAYHRLAKGSHPDMSGGDSREFQRLHDAYDELIDPDRRREYEIKRLPRVLLDPPMLDLGVHVAGGEAVRYRIHVCNNARDSAPLDVIPTYGGAWSVGVVPAEDPRFVVDLLLDLTVPVDFELGPHQDKLRVHIGDDSADLSIEFRAVEPARPPARVGPTRMDSRSVEVQTGPRGLSNGVATSASATRPRRISRRTTIGVAAAVSMLLVGVLVGYGIRGGNSGGTSSGTVVPRASTPRTPTTAAKAPPPTVAGAPLPTPSGSRGRTPTQSPPPLPTASPPAMSTGAPACTDAQHGETLPAGAAPHGCQAVPQSGGRNEGGL